MSNVETIEGIFVAHAKLIPGFKNHVYANERGILDSKLMPMLTMLFLLPQGVEAETGDVEEVSYKWDVYLYVALRDYDAAQTQLKNLACDVVTNFRQHRGDYDLSPDGDFIARGLKRKEAPTPIGAADSPGPEFFRAAWELEVVAGEGTVL